MCWRFGPKAKVDVRATPIASFDPRMILAIGEYALLPAENSRHVAGSN